MFTFITNIDAIPQGTVQVEFNEGKIIKFLTENTKEKLVFGIGNKKDLTLRKFFTLCRKIVRTAKGYGIKNLVIDLTQFNFPKLAHISSERKAEIIAEQFTIAHFEFDTYKKEKEENSLEKIFVINNETNIKKSFERGYLVGTEVNHSRKLANTPGGDITPKSLAKEAIKACRGTEVKVTIFDEKKIKELGMGAVLGVSKGSTEQPRFIILEYWGNLSQREPIILVGKGVTFDSGGLSLKPSNAMLGMHLDMSGGAVVIHTLVLAAKLKIKKNIVGLIPAVENMPSGQSYRPGDILKSMSGKTIEVINTDAEGRLILADALTYAEKYKPRLVVDVATLTGAALVALGERASAIFTKDKKLEELVESIGEETGEYVWPLPLWDEFEEDIKGTFGDLVNAGKEGTGYGGTIRAAMFLYQFAKHYPWLHIDMAPRMVATKSDFLAPGSTGEPIKLLLRLIEKF